MTAHRPGALLCIAVLAGGALTPAGGTGGGDFDGNGLDEIGAFGIEDAGAARGPWLQLYNGNGNRISSFFLGQNLEDVQIVKVDVDGDGRDEVAILGSVPGGQPRLQVRRASGSVLAAAAVADTGAAGLALFAIDVDGVAPAEIGVAYTLPSTSAPVADPLAPLGRGFMQAWRPAAGGTLTRTAHVEAIPAGFAAHTWRVADGNGDGVQELIAGYSLPPSLLAGEPTSRGARARVFAPMSGALLNEIVVAGNAFDGAQWVVGDFVAANPGDELLVGLRRRANSAGVGRVYDPFGAPGDPQGPVATFGATPPGVDEIAWRGLRRARPAPLPGQQPAPVHHHALVGFRQSDQAWGFRVWSVTPPASPEQPHVPLGGGTVLGADAFVTHWIAGELDGDPSDGDSLAIIYRHADRSTALQHWAQAGFRQLAAATLFEASFIEPQALAVVAVQAGREDLAVIARRVGQAPRLQLWNLQIGAERRFQRSVLGPDVR